MPRAAASVLTADHRIVVLRGPDQYLRREQTRRLVETLEEAHGEIGRFDYDGATVEPAVVLDELRSYGLLQAHKLVVVDSADEFLAAKEDAPAGVKTTRQLLERYAESPADGATLLLRADTWRVGKIDKLIEKVGAIIKCETPPAGRAVQFCRDRCSKAYGCTIAPEAAQMLVDRMGPELARLDRELDRLAAYVGESGSITPATVREMVGLSREEKAWVVQEALLSGDPGEALRKVRELLEVSRQPEQLVIWAMIDLVRKLHTASHLLAGGADPGSVGRKLRLFGPGQSALLRAARAAGPRRWAQLLRVAIETDRGTKRGLGRAPRNIETLAVQIADTMRAA